jgi:hypothetical protein
MIKDPGSTATEERMGKGGILCKLRENELTCCHVICFVMPIIPNSSSNLCDLDTSDLMEVCESRVSMVESNLLISVSLLAEKGCVSSSGFCLSKLVTPVIVTFCGMI